MKIAFFALVALHGFIHVIGVVKAFSPERLAGFKKPVSRGWAMGWLLGFLGMGSLAVAFAFGASWWWFLAFPAAIWSQVCIFFFWREARYGTLPNVVVVAAALLALNSQEFDAQIAQEWGRLVPKVNEAEAEVLTLSMTEGLPLSVQRWLVGCGAIGKPLHRGADVRQQFRLKVRPGQEGWYEGAARQRTRLLPPAFVWDLQTVMGPGIPVRGRDLLMEGEGKMTIKVFGAVPVVNEGGNARINEATLQRFLGELAWMPSGAVLDGLEWDFIDDYNAEATLAAGDVVVKGVFTFDEDYDFKQFTTMRYMESGANAQKVPWVVEAVEVREFAGFRIPSRAEATWKLDEGDWTWAQIEVTEIEYW